MDWHLILELDGHSGAYNMATDHAMLRSASPARAFLRLYRWSPPCLSFGRHEPACRRYDRDTIQRLNLDTVRRPTGGRAVWHDAELTYAVAAPAGAFGTLRTTYVTIHTMIATGLRQIGVSVGIEPLGSQPGPLSAGACFATAAGGEIVANGKKLVGSAQVREGPVFLQHGSILLRDRQDVVSRVSRNGAAIPRATSLGSLCGHPPRADEVASAVAQAAREAFGGIWRFSRSDDLEPSDMDFSDPAWTWRR